MKVTGMKHKSIKYIVISLLNCFVITTGAFSAAFYFSEVGSQASSYFFGAGSGAAAVMVFNTVKLAIMLKNPKYRKEQEAAQKDERLISIRNRSMAVSFYTMIICAAVASFVFAAKGDLEKAGHFSGFLCVSTAVYFIAYIILSHKE